MIDKLSRWKKGDLVTVEIPPWRVDYTPDELKDRLFIYLGYSSIAPSVVILYCIKDSRIIPSLDKHLQAPKQ